MVELSRNIKRVHGGLLPSSYPAGYGKDQSGLAALRKGFDDVRGTADNIYKLKQAADATRVQAELNQALRDEAEERKQGVEDGSIDPAQFEPGDDLDFFVGDRVANLQKKLDSIKRETDDPFELEKLKLVKDDLIGQLTEKLQIQQVAALATRVAHEQSEEANKIGAAVASKEIIYEEGITQLAELREASSLSAERKLELESTQIPALAKAGVMGAANRADYKEAVRIIDHPDTIRTMPAAERENLRARMENQRQNYLSIAKGKAHTANALYVDNMLRDIAMNQTGTPVTEYDILHDPRLIDDPESQVTLIKAVRDRVTQDIERATDLYTYATNPYALSQDKRTSLGRELQADITNAYVAGGMALDEAAILGERDFLTTYKFASPQMKGRLRYWAATPTGENYDNLVRAVALIKQVNRSSLTSDTNMAEVTAKAKMIADGDAIGMHPADIAELEIAARNMTAEDKKDLAEKRSAISSVEILAEMDTRLGESIWNLYGYFRDEPPPEFQAATITLFDKFFTLGGGSLEYAYAATEAARSGRWAPTSAAGFGSDAHFQQFPPELAVAEFHKANSEWYYEALEKKLVEDGHISGLLGTPLLRMRGVKLYSDPVTHQQMLAGEVPTYLVEVDGDPILNKDTGKPVRWGDEWHNQPGYKLQVQRAEMLQDRGIIHAIEKEAAVKDEPLYGDPTQVKKRNMVEKMVVGAALDAKNATVGYFEDVKKTGRLTEGSRQYDIISSARRRTESKKYKEYKRRWHEENEANKLIAEIAASSEGAE